MLYQIPKVTAQRHLTVDSSLVMGALFAVHTTDTVVAGKDWARQQHVDVHMHAGR